ncbi:MAG: hypothetical protein H7Y07_12895 [Pyrinomonadaceae bacterium]|nr:hypothetical protein [Sphingobacteriaceae bacterium]
MNTNEQSPEKLIQYLDGELMGKELTDFEQGVAENSAMQAELNNLILTREAIKSYGLKTQVASVHQEMMEELNKKIITIPKSNKVRSLYRMPLNIAASLLVIMLSVGFYQYITISGSKVFNENYSSYELSISRGDDNGISKIETAYSNGRLNVVIAEFIKLKNPNAKDNFLAGQAYLSNNQMNESIRCFEHVLANGSAENDFKDDTEYYLALSYLRNNEPLKAEPILKKINKDKDHLYNDRVSKWTLLNTYLLTLKSSEKN